MTLEPLRKSVIYKKHVITIRHGVNGNYVFTITPTVEMQLSGIALSLEEAFTKARAMIDKLEGKNE